MKANGESLGRERADGQTHPGLCAHCVYCRKIVSAKGSVFWRCAHEQTLKYPRLPVVECAYFERVSAEAASR
ncbi:MAG: hypothetical protein AAF355_04335 [Myxococcota bacterium]